MRYPVRDLAAIVRCWQSKGVRSLLRAPACPVAALGEEFTSDMIAVRDADGNLTEFYDVD